MRKEKEHLSLRVKWLKIAGAHNFGVVWGLKHVIARLCCCISENIYTHWDHFRRGAREREIERVRAQMLHNILYAIRRQHRLKTAKRKNWASTEKNDQREHTKKKISSKRESKRKETAHEHTEKGYVLLLLYCFIFFFASSFSSAVWQLWFSCFFFCARFLAFFRRHLPTFWWACVCVCFSCLPLFCSISRGFSSLDPRKLQNLYIYMRADL